jgi:hypothetical protein
MTTEEDTAIAIFCKMVLEFYEAQEFVNTLLKSKAHKEVVIGRLLDGWMETLRAGNSQDELNELVSTLVDQGDPQNAQRS